MNVRSICPTDHQWKGVNISTGQHCKGQSPSNHQWKGPISRLVISGRDEFHPLPPPLNSPMEGINLPTDRQWMSSILPEFCNGRGSIFLVSVKEPPLCSHPNGCWLLPSWMGWQWTCNNHSSDTWIDLLKLERAKSGEAENCSQSASNFSLFNLSFDQKKKKKLHWNQAAAMLHQMLHSPVL